MCCRVYTTVILCEVYIILEVLYGVHNRHSVHRFHYIPAIVWCAQESYGTKCTLNYRCFTVYTTVIVYRVYIILEVLYGVHISQMVHSVLYVTANVICTQQSEGTKCSLYYSTVRYPKQS